MTNNYTASGFIDAERIADVEALLDRLVAKRAKKLAEVFDEDGLDSVRRALRYARPHGLGLIEATDAIVPMSDEAITDLDNAPRALHEQRRAGHAGQAEAETETEAEGQGEARDEALMASRVASCS